MSTLNNNAAMNAMVVAMESMAGSGTSFQGLTNAQLRETPIASTVNGVSTSSNQDISNMLLNEIAQNTLQGNQNRQSAPTTDDGYNQSRYVFSALTNNATLIKNSKGSIGSIHLVSTLTTTVTAYLKIYNKAVAPIPGTDVPFAVYKISNATPLIIDFPKGLNLSQGIGFAITRNASPIDLLAIGLGEITGQIIYI